MYIWDGVALYVTSKHDASFNSKRMVSNNVPVISSAVQNMFPAAPASADEREVPKSFLETPPSQAPRTDHVSHHRKKTRDEAFAPREANDKTIGEYFEP